MIDITNAHNNKKFAFIKNSIVVDIIIIPLNDNEIVETVKELKNADYYIEVPNDDHIPNIGSPVIDGVIYDTKEYDSWIANPLTRSWEPPIPRPDNDSFYLWNEESKSWIKKG